MTLRSMLVSIVYLQLVHPVQCRIRALNLRLDDSEPHVE